MRRLRFCRAPTVTSEKNADTQLSFSKKIIEAQKITHTPTVKLNGSEIDNSALFSPQELRQAITEAAK